MTSMTTTRPTTLRPLGTVPGSRDDVLNVVLDTLTWRVPQTGGRAALQGAVGAAEAWRIASGSTDLDIWADSRGYATLCGLMQAMSGAVVQHADDSDRLQHTSWVVETTDGPAVIDVTVGDLAVGPVTLVPATDVETRVEPLPDGRTAPRLAGAAGVADLLLRPLLRGRIPAAERIAEARARWQQADVQASADLIDRVSSQLSPAIGTDLIAILDGTEPTDATVTTVRRAYMRATIRRLGSAWRQRRVIVPAGRRAGIAGVRAKGVLVVLVGTDGSGKSTVGAQVADRLDRLGIDSTPAYLGMARGNLPGVGLARRVLGVPSPEELAARQHHEPTAVTEAGTKLDHAPLRRAAAWFYAAEYVFRYFRDIRPHLRVKGRPAVVIADRYVYDLEDSPWPGSRAAKVARRLMPTPDVLLVPDAPDAVIHARKPERPASEQAAQQARYRQLAASGIARHASILVDTSGDVAPPTDPLTPVMAAIVEAMHREP